MLTAQKLYKILSKMSKEQREKTILTYYEDGIDIIAEDAKIQSGYLYEDVDDIDFSEQKDVFGMGYYKISGVRHFEPPFNCFALRLKCCDDREQYAKNVKKFCHKHDLRNIYENTPFKPKVYKKSAKQSKTFEPEQEKERLITDFVARIEKLYMSNCQDKLTQIHDELKKINF